jgi:Bacterial antitoxin of type II TA system, VapB
VVLRPQRCRYSILYPVGCKSAKIHTFIYTYKDVEMATNLAIDNKLIEAARSIGGLKTKKAVVTQALMEYIQKRQQLQIVSLFGSIDYDAGFDYKAQWRRTRTSAGNSA